MDPFRGCPDGIDEDDTTKKYTVHPSHHYHEYSDSIKLGNVVCGHDARSGAVHDGGVEPKWKWTRIYIFRNSGVTLSIHYRCAGVSRTRIIDGGNHTVLSNRGVNGDESTQNIQGELHG